MALPKNLEPCPINEALVEVRFAPSVPDDAVFGLLYEKLKDQYPEVAKLPIHQIPDQLREAREDLEFKPHYRLPGESYIVQIGPRVVSIIDKDDYQGWENLSSCTWKILDKLEDSNVVGDVIRYSVRYTNFFKDNIFEKSKIDISSGDKNLVGRGTYLKTLIESDNSFHSVLQVTNNASMDKGDREVDGSVIDIDTINSRVNGREFFNTYQERINEAHDIEKELFFSLLTEEFLDSFNPEY